MPERVHVFHLIKSLGRGGAEMLLSQGLRYADRDRFHFAYGYFLPWKDALVPDLREQDVPVTCFDATSNARVLLASRRVADHLRAHKVDLVHAHLPLAGVVARLAGRWAGIPVVYTEHNKMERYHVLTRQLNRVTWRWQAHAVAVSDEVRASIHDHVGRYVPVQTVLNGIDVEAFATRNGDGRGVREKYGIEPSACVVGTVAVFRTQKRLDHWLEVAKRLQARRPGIRFLLVGDGPLRDELHARCRELGLEQAVIFAGLQEDVRPFLAAMDVYLMTSQFEGLPLALLEAMAAARPVVATRVGGIPEVVDEGTSGLLADTGDVEQLTEHVCSLLGAPDRRDALGVAGQAVVRHRFSMDRMMRELEALYLDVLQRS